MSLLSQEGHVGAGVSRMIRRLIAAHDVRAARRIVSLDRAQELARRRIPTPVESYVEGGAGCEDSLRANVAEARSILFNPHLGIMDGSSPDLRTTVLGAEVSMPLLLSPVGFTRMMHTDGDVAGAHAASLAQTVFSLSSMSGHTMAEVMAVASRPTWFQLYCLGGRAGAERLVADANDQGFAALVVTMDTQVPGDRRRESRYGLSPPLVLDRQTVIKIAPYAARRPWWLVDQASSGFKLELPLVHAEESIDAFSTASALLEWLAYPPKWKDLEWIGDQFGGPIIVKGILNTEDARRAVDHGASAVIVSNHGGRQLDGIPASLAVLPDIVRAIPQTEVYVDGGVRSGADVVRAVALGARAAMVGRAWAYGLCAAGRPGVSQVLELFREDIDRTMRLLGVSSIEKLDSTFLGRRAP